VRYHFAIEASTMGNRSSTEDEAMSDKAIGRQIQNELLGAGYAEAKDKRRNAFNAVLQDYSEEVCFGRIWAREGIDRKLRSMLNIALLTALNRPDQLGRHVQGALNNGCTMEEIREILLHSAVYCGLPAAAEGFRVAEQVLEARKLLD
jgi:4-carboxymuconolactone decarboxylase